jgi:prevent-host-death family protein
MKSVGAYEAKTHLPQLLQQVEAGETIVITKHGHPVASLSPIRAISSKSVESVIKELRTLRAQMRLEGLSIQELREEGRRF